MSVQRKGRDMQIKSHRGKQGLWKEAMESEKTRFQMGKERKIKDENIGNHGYEYFDTKYR